MLAGQEGPRRRGAVSTSLPGRLRKLGPRGAGKQAIGCVRRLATFDKGCTGADSRFDRSFHWDNRSKAKPHANAVGPSDLVEQVCLSADIIGIADRARERGRLVEQVADACKERNAPLVIACQVICQVEMRVPCRADMIEVCADLAGLACRCPLISGQFLTG